MIQNIPTEQKTRNVILPQMLLLWEEHKTKISQYAPTLNSTVAEMELYELAQYTEGRLRFLFRLVWGLKDEADYKAKLIEYELD